MPKRSRVVSKSKRVDYKYVVLADDGKIVKGTVSADSEAAAEQILISRGYEIVLLTPLPPLLSAERLFPSLIRVKTGDVVVFSRQLATLLESGVTILVALGLLREQVASKPFKRVITGMISDIGTGVSFSQALTKYPQVFSEIYRRTIAVGEQSGSLEIVLRQMAGYLERQGLVAKKVTRAMTYPAIVLAIGLVVGVILVTTVLPPMMSMFESLEAELPLPTKILMGMTDFIEVAKFYLLAAVSLGAVSSIWYLRHPKGRRQLDRILLRAPLIGPPSRMGEVARFSRTMSVMLAAGLPLHEVTEMLPQTSSNRIVRESLQHVHQELLRGEGLSGPMSRMDVFPPLLVQMATVGEETSTLDTTMASVADFYEAAAEDKINVLMAVIEPSMTVVIALMVGFIAISVIMPMYSITGAIG